MEAKFPLSKLQAGLLLVVGAIFLIGASNVYGEPLTAEVDVYSINRTVTIPHPIVDEDCETFLQGFQPLTQCYFAGALYNSTNTQFIPNLIWDDVDEEYKTPEQLEKEAKEDYIESLKVDEDVIEFEGRVFDTETDNPTDILIIKQINNMLETDAHCFQGSDGSNTAGIQNERSFPVPTRTITTFVEGVKYETVVLDLSTVTTNEDLKGFLGKIIAHKLECKAQMILDDPQGGILSSVDQMFGYCDEVDILDTTQLATCGKTYDHKTNAQDVPEWSQVRVNEEANRDDTTDRNPLRLEVCALYSQQTQVALGCPTDEPEQSGGNPTELTNYGAEIEAMIEQFKADDGATMFEQLQKDKIAEDIARLSKQLRELREQ